MEPAKPIVILASKHPKPFMLHLWQWAYTDEFGKRRVFPCRLTEEDGKTLKNAERVEGSLRGHGLLAMSRRGDV